MTCADCGAQFADPDDSCQRRFDVLLALDHSHQEPWGSRHAIAFAVYALQHPSAHAEATRAFAYELLRRVHQDGEPLEWVVRDFRARQLTPRSAVAPADVPPSRDAFAVTIADLGDFPVDRYAVDLDRWVRATLERLA